MSAVPRRLATAAGVASVKKNHTCAPVPDRETSAWHSMSAVAAAKRTATTFAPVRVIEVDGEEVACLILQHRIHANGGAPGEVVLDGRLIKRQQFSIRAIRALHPPLVAKP